MVQLVKTYEVIYDYLGRRVNLVPSYELWAITSSTIPERIRSF